MSYVTKYQQIMEHSIPVENIFSACTLPIGTKVEISRCTTSNEEAKRHVDKIGDGRIESVYPFFVNIRIKCANGLSYVRSINKTDLLIHDYILKEVR